MCLVFICMCVGFILIYELCMYFPFALRSINVCADFNLSLEVCKFGLVNDWCVCVCLFQIEVLCSDRFCCD